MAYEEVQGNGGGNMEDMEPREFVSAKIGTSFEGTFVDMRPAKEGKYGSYRPTLLDLNDGRKVIIRASRYLLERLESADLRPGDGLKIVIEAKKAQQSGNTYGNPRVYIDRKGGQPEAPVAAAEPAPAAPEPPKAAPAPSTDDLPF